MHCGQRTHHVSPPCVQCTPPVCIPPVCTPPVCTPPVCTPPVCTPPVCTPPVCTPPVSPPPVSPLQAWAEVSGNGRAHGEPSVWKRNFRSALRAKGFKVVSDNRNDAANPHKVYRWPDESSPGGEHHHSVLYCRGYQVKKRAISSRELNKESPANRIHVMYVYVKLCIDRI